MWVYIQSEPGLYTVGFYTLDGQWQPDSDWQTRDDAAKRVHYLNGGVGNLVEPVSGTGREPQG